MRMILAVFLGFGLAGIAHAGEPAGKIPPRTDLSGDPLPAGAIARLGTVRFRTSGMPRWLAFMPDGKGLVSWSHDGAIRLWDVATGRETRQLKGDQRAITSVAHSPNGKFLAATSDNVGGDALILVWEVATGKERAILGEGQGLPFGIAFGPDSTTLASGNWYGEICLWDVRTGKQVRHFQGLSEGRVLSIAFSPDGRTLAAAGLQPGDHNRICLWDLATGKELRRWKTPQWQVDSLAFFPDGRRLMSVGRSIVASDDDSTRLWEVATGKEVGRFNPPLGGGVDAVSSDLKVLAQGNGMVIHLWHVGDEKELRRIHAETRSSIFFSAALSPDGTVLATGGRDNTIRLWSVANGKEINPCPLLRGAIETLAFSPNGQLLAAAGRDRASHIFDPVTGRELRTCEGHEAPVLSIAFSPDGKMLASGSSDGTVRLWEAAKGKQARLLLRNRSEVRSLAFSLDGKRLVSGGGDCRLRLWDVSAGREIQTWSQEHAVSSVACSSDGRTIASAGGQMGDKILLWDAVTGKQNQQLEPKADVHSLAFSPDGKTLASAGRDKLIRLWEVPTGQERCELKGHTDVVNSVTFSRDGRYLASGSNDRTVRIWQLADGRELQQFQGHRGRVRSVALSADGSLLASGSDDTTVLLWDMAACLPRTRPLSHQRAPKEWQALWIQLKDRDARKAYRAIWTFVEAPEQAIPFLREHLQPILSVDQERVSRYIGALDSERFSVREEAMRELETMGDLAEPGLREAVGNRPSLEKQRRLERLLSRIEGSVVPPKSLRELRAIEVLEKIGTGDAQSVLKVLAGGAAESRGTREAKASVERLGRLGLR